MYTSTTEVYTKKRVTVNFIKGLVSGMNLSSWPFKVFLKSGNVILRNIAAALNEPFTLKAPLNNSVKTLHRPLHYL